MKILLIGAGQLGSRHLQGLLKLEEKSIIFVLDPSEESLATAEIRAKEISHNSEISYVTKLDLVPINLELVIVATNSNIRENVVAELLTKHEVKYLILEKVLFQQLESYNRIEDLIAKSNVKVWVNHPRRMVGKYEEIRNTILAKNEKVVFDLVGGNWGLGCNGLHFLDLLTYLTNDELECIDESYVDNLIHESKRKNYIEFTGTLKGKTKNGHIFSITSFNGIATPITITIGSTSSRWSIIEGTKSKVAFSSSETDFNKIEDEFIIDYQSNLTTEVIKNLLKNGQCKLPTYNEAAKTHMLFIEALLRKFNHLSNSNTEICQIT